MVPVFKNIGERSMGKYCCSASLLSMVSKVFEKLPNNNLIDQLKKGEFLSFFQYGFISSRSTSYLLNVASDKIGRDSQVWGY